MSNLTWLEIENPQNISYFALCENEGGIKKKAH